MKRISYLLLAAVVAMAFAVSGCVITSAQVFAHYDLPDPFTLDSSSKPFAREDVDLNTVSEYKDNKDKLKHLSDVAFGGRFRNLSGPAGSVEVWMTPGPTNYTSVSQIQTSAIKLWGPSSIGASVSEVTLKWDDSAKLFTTPGKQALIDEVKGDGQFTIYLFGTGFGTGNNYTIEVQKGTILLVLDASK
jgi:hypothetical protein